MNIKEFLDLSSGTRVLVKVVGEDDQVVHVVATAGKLWSGEGPTAALRFEDGSIVTLDEESVQAVVLEN